VQKQLFDPLLPLVLARLLQFKIHALDDQMKLVLQKQAFNPSAVPLLLAIPEQFLTQEALPFQV